MMNENKSVLPPTSFGARLLNKISKAMVGDRSPKMFLSNPALDRCYASLKAGYDVVRYNKDGSLRKGLKE